MEEGDTVGLGTWVSTLDQPLQSLGKPFHLYNEGLFLPVTCSNIFGVLRISHYSNPLSHTAHVANVLKG